MSCTIDPVNSAYYLFIYSFTHNTQLLQKKERVHSHQKGEYNAIN